MCNEYIDEKLNNRRSLPRVVVAHPSKQHSFYTASAFEQAGMLEAYITTIYDKEGSVTNILKRILRGNELKKLKTRSCELLPNKKVVQFFEFDYLISIFLNRFHSLRIIREQHRKYVAKKFGRKVALYVMKHEIDAVVMYDSTAEECFKILKKKCPKVLRILDVSIATRPFMKKNFENDMKIFNHKELYKEHIDFWNTRNMNSYIREIELANAYFVPSDIVKRSITFCDENAQNIKIIPYGVDIDKFSYSEKQKDNKCLNIIYVGQVTHRKGIHHLLNVISKFPKDKIKLDLVGTYDKKSNLYIKYNQMENINFCGFITRDKLSQKYKSSDLFVFPTLGEGFGLVVLESLACGVPVLCSDLAGGDDAIQEGVNGFKFNPFNEQELKLKIQYCIDNIENIRSMNSNCRNSILEYTWDNYYSNIITNFMTIWGEKYENSSYCTNEVE